MESWRKTSLVLPTPSVAYSGTIRFLRVAVLCVFGKMSSTINLKNRILPTYLRIVDQWQALTAGKASRIAETGRAQKLDL